MLYLFGCVALFLVAVATPGSACTCPRELTLTEEYERDVVVIGRVVSSSDEVLGATRKAIYQLAVVRAIKGVSSDSVDIETNLHSPCFTVLAIDETYVVYGPRLSGRIVLDRCSRVIPLSLARDDLRFFQFNVPGWTALDTSVRSAAEALLETSTASMDSVVLVMNPDFEKQMDDIFGTQGENEGQMFLSAFTIVGIVIVWVIAWRSRRKSR